MYNVFLFNTNVLANIHFNIDIKKSLVIYFQKSESVLIFEKKKRSRENDSELRLFYLSNTSSI